MMISVIITHWDSLNNKKIALTNPTGKLLCDPDPGLFFFINQGCLGVDNMDDAEEMRLTDVCNNNELSALCVFKSLHLGLTLVPLPWSVPNSLSDYICLAYKDVFSRVSWFLFESLGTLAIHRLVKYWPVYLTILTFTPLLVSFKTCSKLVLVSFRTFLVKFSYRTFPTEFVSYLLSQKHTW